MRRPLRNRSVMRIRRITPSLRAKRRIVFEDARTIGPKQSARHRPHLSRNFHARASRLLENGSALQTIQEELSSLKLPESLKRNGLHIFSWKMSPACCRMTQAGHLNNISSALVELGYGVEWCVHNSANFGVPQQRRRLYIVASLGGRGTGTVFPLACGNAENLKRTYLRAAGIKSL